MGTIRNRKGTWYIDYTHNGRRVKKALKGVKTRREAQKVLDAIMGDIAREKHKMPKKKIHRTFEQVAFEWLEKYCKAKLARSTYERNRSAMTKYFIPPWGSLDITEVTPKHIEDLIVECYGRLKPATIHRNISPLSGMFECAMNWDYISDNPAEQVIRPRIKEQPFDFLVQNEVARLLSVCEGELYDFVSIAVHTGMRRGEILDLRMRQVNLDRGIITIKKAKSGRVRHIPIHSDLVSVLQSISKDRILPKSAPYYVRRFKRALRKAGLREIRPHDLRHTFASNFVMAGGSIIALQKILGHKDLKQTLKYAHLAPGYLDGEIEKVTFRPALVPVKEEEEDK